MKTSDFSDSLLRELIKNINNIFFDNIKTYTSKHYEYHLLVRFLRKFIHNFRLLSFSKQEKFYSELLGIIHQFILVNKEFNNIYEILDDEYSRNLFLNLVAYRILGYRRYKLPLNNPEYWQLLRKIEKSSDLRNYIDPNFLNFKLFLFNVDNAKHNISLYYMPIGVLNTFYLKQYVCPSNNAIKAQVGDIVIDAGGCWGDTALYFASEVGETGKVYSFEFIPTNIEIMKKNLDQNPKLKESIEVIANPLWSSSGETMYYIDNGPASRISFEKFPESNVQGETISISIDDFTERFDIQKINFIKMDIEGAEINALKGSIKSLKRFKPKLAISVYHNCDDLSNISEFINSLGLDYKLYLGHFTTHSEETVIYAI